MRYILFSPKHEVTIPEVVKTNGERIPERTHTVFARALYRMKSLPERRYRRDYPEIDREMVLLKCKSIKEAKLERDQLKEYCGEEFEIREYENGIIGHTIEV